MAYGNVSNIPSRQPQMASVTASAAELNDLDGVTDGTVAVSKAVVVDANKDVGDFRNLDVTNLDAGLSGTAGSVDVFPTTASKGKVAITAANSAGDTTTTLVNASQAGARTYTIPDALAAAEFLLGSQAAVARTATADGSGDGTIADKGMFQFIAVTSAGANNIIVLPTPTPGTVIAGYVGATGFELRSSSVATVAINGGTDTAGESAIAANMFFLVVCTSATTWMGLTITGTTLASMEAAAD